MKYYIAENQPSVRERIQSEDRRLSESLIDLAVAVDPTSAEFLRESEQASVRDAVRKLLGVYGVREVKELPKLQEDTMRQQLKDYFADAGFSVKWIRLQGDWYRTMIKPALVRRKDGEYTTIVSRTLGRLAWRDDTNRKWVYLNARTAQEIEEEALVIFPRMDHQALPPRALLSFLFRGFPRRDAAALILLALGVMVMGMMTPAVTKWLFSTAILLKDHSQILVVFVLLISAALSSLLLQIVQSQMNAMVVTRADANARAGTLQRLLSLPTEFFRKYTVGDLFKRIQIIPMFCTAFMTGILTTGLSAAVSLLYLIQIYTMAPVLAGPLTVVTAVMIGFTVLCVRIQSRVNLKKMKYSTMENSLLYAIVTGIQTIRLTGSEKRIFTKWAGIERESAAVSYRPPFPVRFSQPIYLAISLTGTLLVYYTTMVIDIPSSGYMAVISAYGMLTGVFLTMQTMIPQVSLVKPMLELIRPLMETEPEATTSGRARPEIQGGIQISHVNFRYEKHQNLLLQDFSLSIRPGEYLGIVGKSGSGKSTLMRLMLGFEKPESGAVYYDGNNLKNMDLRYLRRKMGIVVQDGMLFPGSIYENISIGNPGMNMDTAWEAAERAGIAEDIRRMPMGMFTLLDENAAVLSGGQRQRILIARALAANPKILLMDEATSALDNLTQRIVIDALRQMNSTRIVIAHRLSTVRDCDRIVMIEKGQIIESGTYNELIRKNGAFAQMVRRQQIQEA